MKYIKLFIIVLVLSGCAVKDIKEQSSKFIVMKTPEIKFADMGFVSTFDDKLNIQIYSSGEAVLSINIYKNKICTSTFECMDKKKFNTKFFNTEYYPSDTLEKIFLAKPIFSDRGIEKISNGYTQKIFEKNKYDIFYKVINKDIEFNDKINNIIIKVQDI